jgi:hypothetical protein
MSSIKPNNSGGQVNGGEEVACGFSVSRRNGPVLLEPGEEILNEVARFISVPIEIARRLPAGLGWDDGGLIGCGQRFDHALIGIERLVGDQRVSLHVRQQVVGPHQIVRLAAGQVEADRVAEGID